MCRIPQTADTLVQDVDCCGRGYKHRKRHAMAIGMMRPTGEYLEMEYQHLFDALICGVVRQSGVFSNPSHKEISMI